MVLLARLLILFSVFFVSCGGTHPVRFPVRGTNAALAAVSRSAAAGIIDFAGPEKLEYRFEASIPSFSSLEIEYDFSVPPSMEITEQYRLILETDGDSWALPMEMSFLGISAGGAGKPAVIIHYAIPIRDPFSGRFSIHFTAIGQDAKKISSTRELPRFQIRSLEIKERWFGYYQEDAGGVRRCFTSPFVYKRGNAQDAAPQTYVIDPPNVFAAREKSGPLPELLVELLPGREAAVTAGNRRFEALPYAAELRVPAGICSPEAGPLIVSGDRVKAFQVTYIEPPPFPRPIAADPGVILAWPEEQWRNSRYELFRWEQFPSLLIFDTADYAVQDRLFKRLAFFTEKAGFRGRLAPDEEIAGLHGWNAHDYRSEDLARFFEAARASNFPLLPEERELEKILLDNGIIRSGGGITGGGGIISISRESAPYLRSMFMVHEAFHGLFFIDADFRAFSRGRWESLPSPAKRFITSYFGYQHYDIKDEYLMINEFMAHILQQPISQASRYFGETLPSRIETSPWRRAALPEQDPVTGLRPVLAGIFTAEAEAFSAYVNRRWGLAAGRVRQVTVRVTE